MTTFDREAYFQGRPRLVPVEPHEDVEPVPITIPPKRTATVQPPSLAEHLADVEAFLRRYIAFPSEHEAPAVALWIAQAYLVDLFETSPLLAITSAEMRSGKTRLHDCLELLVPTPHRVITPSEAVTFTVLAQRPRPTLMLDEADTIFGPRTAERYEGIRAILNAGNRKGTPVLRVKLDGKRREVESFDVYGPKAIAGIGDLPPTVADRSIPIRLRRRASDEPVARFRRRTAEAEAKPLAYPWHDLRITTEVPVPDELPDRAADSWEPLLAIADAAGGTWPKRARDSAIALSAEEQQAASAGMRLLADVRDAFALADHLPTAELLRRLHEMDDAPWAEWYGKPLSGRGLAKLLGPYRIVPAQRRVTGEKSRGYFRADFTDAWTRYVPLPAPGTSGTSGAARAPVPDVPDVPGAQTATEWDPELASDDDAEVAS